jgi:hypothetical protein
MQGEWSGQGYRAPVPGTVHHIVGLRRGGAVRYYLDGRLVHDYLDAEPHGRGQMGFCLWRNTALLHESSVWRIDGHRPAASIGA